MPVPEGEAPPPPPAPAYTLFNADAAALATFLGTPLAGAILMAVNYRRLGKGGSAAAVLAAGLLLAAVALFLALALPQGAGAGIALAFLFAVKGAAKALQGTAVAQHVAQGGKLGSRWIAAGLGISILAIVVGGYLLYDSAANPKVKVGAKDEIYYSGTATKEEATTLGQTLKGIGFLADRGASIFISKGKDGTVVSFVVKEGTWNDPQSISSFEEIGRQIAPSVGGFPIKVRLINPEKVVKKELSVGKAIIGTKDIIYYYGSATGAEAKALGQALQTEGFFNDKGYSVLFSKRDGTVLGFVVRDGYPDEPGSVETFEKMTRNLAPSVGGLPIKLRLLNTALDIKKEVVVQ